MKELKNRPPVEMSIPLILCEYIHVKSYCHMKIFCYGVGYIYIIILFIIFSCLLFLSPEVAAVTGPHGRKREDNNKGVCANCHMPHGAKEGKLWALEIPPKIFGGARARCYSCHNDLLPYGNAYKSMSLFGESFILGKMDVFDPDRFEDHVMHGGAEYENRAEYKDWGKRFPYAISLISEVDIGGEFFPVDPTDWDTVPKFSRGNIYGRKNINYQKGKKGAGMYCGTCHNPHQDLGYGDLHGPSSETQGGAYLRPGKGGGVGSWDSTPDKDAHRYGKGKRKEFCIKCHGIWHFEHHGDCLECHHPHRGANVLTDIGDGGLESALEKNNLIELAGRFIFTAPLSDWPPSETSGFRALPNVSPTTDNITKLPESAGGKYPPSAFCYCCHGPKGAQEWGPKGATTIHGDDSSTPREHHPPPRIEKLIEQGEKGLLTYDTGNEHDKKIVEGDELYCFFCHKYRRFFMPDNNDVKIRNNNYLKWDFSNDSASFCTECHHTKKADYLGVSGKGHHQTRGSAFKLTVTRKITEWNRQARCNVQKEVGCGNCMFCHFIHDGQNSDGTQRGDLLTPDLDALMRVPPLNLAWADKWADKDLFDYEDMCFGCHGNSKIVKDSGPLGSLLVPPKNLDPAELTVPGSMRFSHRFATPPLSETTTANIQVGGKFPLSDGWMTSPSGSPVEGTVNDYGVDPGLIFCGTCHNVHDNCTNPGSPYLRGTSSPYMPMGFCEECHTSSTSTMFIDPLLNHPLGKETIPPTGDAGMAEFTAGLRGEKGGDSSNPSGGPFEVGMIICLTCHSVHAASTTFDGHADFPRSLAKVSSQGNHGKLLVMDNYSDSSGSDMCICCHPDSSRIAKSPHDFSPGYRPGCKIGQKGVCSACHVPHNAASDFTLKGKPVLWARNLADEEGCFQQRTNPAYTLGDTLLCYDCHSRCDDDPPSGDYGPFIPQDIAFVDGPEGEEIGYYEVFPSSLQDIPPYGSKTGGHSIKSPSFKGIMAGDKLACNECHDPHRGWTRPEEKVTEAGEKAPKQNQAFIKEYLAGKQSEEFYASSNMTYHQEIRNNKKSRSICINCHCFSYNPASGSPPTPVPFTAVNPSWASSAPITSPTPLVFEHSSSGVNACTDCHRHSRVIVLCIDCHAFPPSTVGDGWSGPGDTDENYPGGAGAHRAHVVNRGFDCSTCHTGCLHNPDGGTIANLRFDRSKVCIDFNPLFGFPRKIGKNTTKISYSELSPSYNPLEQVCFVGCHNPLIGETDELPNLDNPTPNWSLALKDLPKPPTYPSPPLPTWMPDPRKDTYYRQLLIPPQIQSISNQLVVP